MVASEKKPELEYFDQNKVKNKNLGYKWSIKVIDFLIDGDVECYTERG